ncbi:unnamed protein product [Toxocara canis]|uniref:Uncharacterized protein n=1 Tax=Toxocara canis TaxID=6265 RepID=A0A183UAJ7_TOXCA|nr:unnamed protein product [Toxocara canis]
MPQMTDESGLCDRFKKKELKEELMGKILVALATAITSTRLSSQCPPSLHRQQLCTRVSNCPGQCPFTIFSSEPSNRPMEILDRVTDPSDFI